MKYRIEVTPRAARDLAALPRAQLERVSRKIDGLAVQPRPRGVTKLSGAEDLHRIRVGDYRVVYQIKDDILLIVLIRIGHRRDIYR